LVIAMRSTPAALIMASGQSCHARHPLMSRLLTCALLLASALLAPAAVAQSAADVAEARELFLEGAKLARQGKWAEAGERYRRSLALRRSPMTLYSLGVAQMSSDALVEALESFRAFLIETPTPKSKAYRRPAATAITELEQRVGRVSIEVQPAGAAALEVKLDGESVPVAALGRARLVNPGEHTVAAQAQGYLPASDHFTATEGGGAQVSLRLQPAPVAETPEAGGAAAEQPSYLLPALLMGGGAAVLAVGVGVGVAALGQASDAPTSDGPDAEAARTTAVVADVLGGVGLAAIAVGTVVLVLKLTSGDEPNDAAPADMETTLGRIEPWARGPVAGLGLRF